MKMKNKEEMTATISASTGLFDFLKEKVGDRKTRTEAYCDLLDKSLAGFVSPFLRKQDFQLQQGQCHVTVSDLAAEWHWHRATVRSFLETLESLGQLERTRLPKSMVITMRLHDGNPCGKVVHKAITDAGLKDELPEDDCHVTLMKLSERMDKRVLEIRNTAIECIVLAAMRKVLCRAKPDERMELTEYLCCDLEGRWPSLIDLSEELAEHIINLSKDKDIDYDDDRQVLLNNLHDPFMSVAAKALVKSADADC